MAYTRQGILAVNTLYVFYQTFAVTYTVVGLLFYMKCVTLCTHVLQYGCWNYATLQSANL
jgi:hypothetical protein